MRHSLTLKEIIEKQFQCNKLKIVPCHISLNLNEEVLISSAKALFIVGETFTRNNRLESLDPSAHFMRLCTTLLSEKKKPKPKYPSLCSSIPSRACKLDLQWN